MTEIDVIDYILNKDEILSNTYDVYQDLLYYRKKEIMYHLIKFQKNKMIIYLNK